MFMQEPPHEIISAMILTYTQMLKLLDTLSIHSMQNQLVRGVVTKMQLGCAMLTTDLAGCRIVRMVAVWYAV